MCVLGVWVHPGPSLSWPWLARLVTPLVLSVVEPSPTPPEGSPLLAATPLQARSPLQLIHEGFFLELALSLSPGCFRHKSFPLLSS